ncbi:hypothetical protein LTR70_004226 [Exophiala xenobiotica]|uniref:Uncharacterized protein n=1 Tax=Lithohypha guttulata TaxID=1690604 RepID=A0ABR0KEC0_9EURO|nr:hypothetical protein LTR24_003708 [Lithohypha guttulata]KAK5321513.1 hypothetical protein LTR70_004226 [Exophiala xenobiotica]
MSQPWMERVRVAQGFPKPSTDAAPTAVFLALFSVAALTNIFIFLRNNRRGHKFLFNGFCIGFCMARVVTTSLRLGWMYNLDNRGLAIAATIFVAAGVLILFIINLLFAQRILRGLHPHLGWHKAISRTLLVLYLLIPLLLVMVVTASTQSFFTTHPATAKADLNMQRGASTYFMFFAFLPIPIVTFALVYPKRNDPDHFGQGHFWLKSAVVLTASVLLTLGAAFRTSTIFISNNTSPPWYNAKWCFYFFNFTLEIIVIVLYVAVRIDLLFHIPNGSKGPYSYSREEAAEQEVEIKSLQRRSTDRTGHGTDTSRSPMGALATEDVEV